MDHISLGSALRWQSPSSPPKVAKQAARPDYRPPLRDIVEDQKSDATSAKVVANVMDAIEEQATAPIGGLDTDSMVKDLTMGVRGQPSAWTIACKAC